MVFHNSPNSHSTEEVIFLVWKQCIWFNFRFVIYTLPNFGKGDQAIEDAEPESVSFNGAENWYESTLWVMETIFDMRIDIEAYLLVHPAQNGNEQW